LPAGIKNGGLDMVSCPSVTNCVAIGEYSGGSGVLTEVWNGKAWTPGKLLPPAGIRIYINALACAAVNDCLAAGYYSLAKGYQTYPLAESWNGRKWTAIRLPHPAKTVYAYLYGVSCATRTSCVAVGTVDLSTGTGGALADSLTGAKWSYSTPPAPAHGFSATLSGVSCAAAKSCVAVGYYTAAPDTPALAESWNGKTWKPVRVPGAANAQLAAIACVSATRCVAVGGEPAGSYSATLSGSSWKTAKMSAPRGYSWADVNAVSCRAADGCVAVGEGSPSLGKSSYDVSWLWNGKSWRTVGTP
jgi:hypothetical protein